MVDDALERLEHELAVGRPDAGAAVDDADVDAAAPVDDDLAGRDPHGRVGRRVAHGVADEVGERPLQQRGVGEHVGQRLGHVDLDVAGGRAEAGDARRARPPRRRSAARRRCSADACSRLMSSRLPTMSASRSVSSSIVASNSSTASGDHSTSRWRRLEIDALIDASGVRRSCDTACSSDAAQGVGGGQVGGPAGLALQPLALGGRGDLGGERVEQALVLGRQRHRRRAPA